MFQIHNNRLHAITIRTVRRAYHLIPGTNEWFSEKDIKDIKTHPVFQKYYQEGVLTIPLSKIEAKGTEEGFRLADHKELGDEIVITNQEDLKNKTYRPDKGTLKAYAGVGEKTAQQILALMPKGGWASKADFKKDTEHFQIDWSPSGLKAKTL